MKRILLAVLMLQCLISCNNIPKNSQTLGRVPAMTPDCVGITVPSNIAPIGFAYDEQGSSYVTEFSSGSVSVVLKGDEVLPSAKQWTKLLEASSDIQVKGYVRQGGEWFAFEPFSMEVAEPVDPYLAYRLIPPSFENYEVQQLMIRDLSSFDEREFYNNTYLREGNQVQCVNCHYFRNQGTSEMQIHVRQYLGGTMLLRNGEVTKINLKNDSTISNGVYTAWHPTHNYIVYTTNSTLQDVHSIDKNLIEVLDDNSQLIMYDLDKDLVSIVEDYDYALECYPCWSPDGRRLYFTSAYMSYEGPAEGRNQYVYENSEDIHYDLYYKDFDPETAEWGSTVKLIDAASMNQSITLPRVSPDGRYLMFTMGRYGVFHIWHPESDLYLMDLSTGEYRPIDEINSQNAESYHTWSSNGSWVVYSTRREDSGFTRLYLAHHNGDGSFDKPFALPMRNPRWSTFYLNSFNIPEFSKEDIPYTSRELSKLVKELDIHYPAAQTAQ